MGTATATQRIGSYVLEGERGRGAFGVVYRAHHVERPDVPVALKVVDNRGNLDRLLLEPALLSRLHHPNIVRLEDYFVEGDRLVLALEYIDGDDLKTCLDRGDVFDQPAVRNLLVQLAGALAHAHANNIIHRDLKLSNILVTRGTDGLRFVLTDFGIGQQSEGIQLEKHTGGTYYFMAPEQLRGRPCPQSDLWALGVVAYRLLAGRLPFTADSVLGLSSQIFYATPLPPSKCTTEPIDATLETIVFHLLDKTLNGRTATADELLQELGQSTTGLTPTPSANVPPPLSQQALDRQIAGGIRRYQILLGCALAVVLLQKGLIAGAMLFGGLALFFLAYQRLAGRRLLQAATFLGSFALFIASTLVQASARDLNLVSLGGGPVGTALLRLAVTMGGQYAGTVLAIMGVVLYGLFIVFFLLAPPVAAYCYAELRRRQRDRALRRAILESAGDPDRYLDTLRTFLSDRFEDVAFHLKYIEALLAHGRLTDVAVEAKLLLRQDPYNFNGNLYLANAYDALGLPVDCAGVCDAYLRVTGYCFEFAELREQCRRKGAP